MSYALKNDGKGWRAVNDQSEVNSDETYSQERPDPIAPSRVPEVVTMRQARLALLQAGKLAAVNAAVSAFTGSDGDAARIEWEFSNSVERHRPLVLSFGTALGLTESDLDDLFVLAATL